MRLVLRVAMRRGEWVLPNVGIRSTDVGERQERSGEPRPSIGFPKSGAFAGLEGRF